MTQGAKVEFFRDMIEGGLYVVGHWADWEPWRAEDGRTGPVYKLTERSAMREELNLRRAVDAVVDTDTIAAGWDLLRYKEQRGHFSHCGELGTRATQVEIAFLSGKPEEADFDIHMTDACIQLGVFAELRYPSWTEPEYSEVSTEKAWMYLRESNIGFSLTVATADAFARAAKRAILGNLSAAMMDELELGSVAWEEVWYYFHMKRGDTLDLIFREPLP